MHLLCTKKGALCKLFRRWKIQMKVDLLLVWVWKWNLIGAVRRIQVQQNQLRSWPLHPGEGVRRDHSEETEKTEGDSFHKKTLECPGNRWPRTLSDWVLKLSGAEESTTSLGKLFQYLTLLRMANSLLEFSGNLHRSNFVPITSCPCAPFFTLPTTCSPATWNESQPGA